METTHAARDGGVGPDNRQGRVCSGPDNVKLWSEP